MPSYRRGRPGLAHRLGELAQDAFSAMESDSIRAGAIEAVNELDPKLRFVLMAHVLDGVSMPLIAEAAGLPLSTLYRRRAKAIGALRYILHRRDRRERSTQKAALR